MGFRPFACASAIVVALVGAVEWPASAADPDPNFQAVQVVCGKCHSTKLFLDKPRSWDRWNDVFQDMTQRGAKGSDEELTRVTSFFLENLTFVNINTSPADELTGVLGIGYAVADDIIARRQKQPFTTIAQIVALPGVDRAIVEQRKARILF